MCDEPAAGLSPAERSELIEILLGLPGHMGFIIIEHDMDMIARLCDPVIVMAEGRKLTQGTFAEIAADHRVQEAYMGGRRWAS